MASVAGLYIGLGGGRMYRGSCKVRIKVEQMFGLSANKVVRRRRLATVTWLEDSVNGAEDKEHTQQFRRFVGDTRQP